MGWKSSDVVRLDLWPLEDQMRIAKLKSAYNSLVIGPRGLQCETNQSEIMGCESSDVVRFDLGPFLQGQMRVAKLKSAFNSLLKNAVYLQNYVSWPLLVDTSCIWPQMRPWSSYPTALKGCRGIVFTHGVRMGGRAGGRMAGARASGKKFVRAVSQKP